MKMSALKKGYRWANSESDSAAAYIFWGRSFDQELSYHYCHKYIHLLLFMDDMNLASKREHLLVNLVIVLGHNWMDILGAFQHLISFQIAIFFINGNKKKTFLIHSLFGIIYFHIERWRIRRKINVL